MARAKAHLQNVLTHDRAYCLHPVATFERRTTLVTSPSSLPYLPDPSAREWNVLTPADIKDEELFGTAPRWICDSRSWVLPLDFEGTSAPSRHPITATSWQLGRLASPVQSDGAQQATSAYLRNAVIVESESLVHTYLILDDDIWGVVRPIITKAMAEEHARLKSAGSLAALHRR